MKNRREKSSIVLLIIVLCFPNVLAACSCAYGGKFSKYTSGDNGVIRAKIKSYGPRLPHGKTLYESMVVEVTEVIKGEYTGQELTFLGDPGNLCRAYVNSEIFKVGSEHFIAIASEKSVQPLGGCGESSVMIKGDVIEGKELTNNGYKPYTLKTLDLVKLLKSQRDKENMRQ